MSRGLKSTLLLGAKGLAMGAADVVPGVSGGTIAFISGIYGELVTTIKDLPASVPVLFQKGPVAFWRASNLGFLLTLVAGIGLSIFSLAGLMTWLLETWPIPTWSFFFGLLLASIAHVLRQIEKPTWACVPFFVVGTAVAWWITSAAPASTPNDLWFYFVCGSVAICAMILPGISGSFILLLMGKYAAVLGAVRTLQLDILAVFAAGALVGILAFSHVLSWMLKKFPALAVSLLAGFMLGSLNKVWPWKQTLTTYTDSHGDLHPLLEANVLPGTWETLTGQAAQLPWALGALAVGLVIVVVIETIASRKAKSGAPQN